MTPRKVSLVASVLCMFALASACGSTPAAPSGQLTIAGQIQFNQVGQTGQLRSTLNGNDVTSQTSWHSSNVLVATVSAAGLLTTTGFGTAVVTGTDGNSAGTAQVTVASTIAIGCQSIAFAGSYVVIADLTATVGNPCIQVSNVSNVQLDCQNHKVTNIVLTNATDVSVRHCVFASSVVGTNVTRLTFDADTVLVNGLSLTGAVASSVTNSSVTGRLYVISLSEGHDNQISGNTLEGGYDGGAAQVGADDGILLVDEANDTVTNNTIADVYDAGIESANILTNTTIANNKITNAAEAGIASYYCTSWSGNTIDGNMVSQSAAILWVLYQMSATQCGITEAPANFTNNRFTGNQFASPRQPASNIGFNINFHLFPGAVSNNLIQGNVLGAPIAMTLEPIAGFTDGGGNVCQPGQGFCGS